ncbi:alpha/beta fold hydrolase [Actinomycetospora sp. TBRC 11914]|nr:alpha/beta fold hydrolase [Actinomycetospora sp. TBRC 11914]
MTLHHHEGHGPTLLFLHYWGGSAATWRPVQDRLPDHAMLAWDQRGWGEQADRPGPWGITALADDAEAVVDRLGVRDVVVVGHSQGGKVAQILARRRPAWLRGLVLVAPAPPRPPHWITAAYQEQLAHAYDTADTVAAALDDVLTANPLPADLRAQVIADSTGASAAVRRDWPLHGIAADLGPGAISTPTLVIVGESDRVEPPRALRELLLPTLPAATDLTVVPGAGHLLPLEAPDAVAAAIRKVLG